MRIKSFADVDPAQLEERVNEWLSENPDADVIQFAQTESLREAEHSTVTITLLYREKEIERREAAVAMFASEDMMNDPVMEFPEPERLGAPA